MIASAMGANVIAIDIDEAKLALARELRVVQTINGSAGINAPEAVIELTRGGAHMSLDALSHPVTCLNSIQNLRPRGKHIQVGLMLGDHAMPQVPMARIIGKELEILDSHDMQTHRYGAMPDMIASGKLTLSRLVGRRISLAQAPEILRF